MNLTLLVLEDNHADFVLLKAALSASALAQANLVEVTTVASALRQLSEQTFDAVLTDLNLPDSRGLSTVDALRRASVNTPLIVLTGSDASDAGVKAINRGAEDFVSKGKLDPQLLERAILHSLERFRLRAQLAKSEERFRVAFCTSPVLVFNQDTNLVYTWVHNVGHPWTSEYFVGKTDRDWLPPDEAEYIIGIKERVLQTGHGFRGEFTCSTPIGKICYDLTLEPMRDSTGKAIGLVGAAYDLSVNKRLLAERDRLIGELTTALARVRTLSGIIPICAACKKIRSDHGYWQQVEEFVQQHSLAEFSHGLCPDCLGRVTKDLPETTPKP
jgi:CheY-like chemotaxis protein